MPRLPFAIILTVLLSLPSLSSSTDFDIRLRNNNQREHQAAEQLRRLLDTHDVSPFIFTYSVMIDEFDAPHSHPVLTINAVYLDDDNSALSIFLHEQMHWFETVLETQINAAIEDLKTLYPRVPAPWAGGARDDHSTYVHLIVGMQEFDAMSKLVGRAEAERVFRRKPNYRWVYRQVLENREALQQIVYKHNLGL